MAEREVAGQAMSLLEWISAALGMLLALAILGFIAWEAFGGPERKPPAIEVLPLAVTATGGSFVLEIEVRNGSDQTAAALQVEGELRDGTGSVEKSQAVLSYVPGQSERRAGLIFSKDPRLHRVSLRATGYERP